MENHKEIKSILKELSQMKKQSLFLIITVILLTLSACTKKNNKYLADEKAGIEYYQNGSYDKALASLKKAYGSGSMEAAYYLGEMYRQGNGVEKNKVVSCNYYQKSAEGGSKKAFLKAGTCHIPDTRDGEGFKETFKWFKKASEELKKTDLDESEEKDLYIKLGIMYYGGKGTLQDFSEAAKWFEKAAEMGDAYSQGGLALLYYSGDGVLTDRKKARYWAEKAAAQGDDTGELVLGMLNQYSLPPEQNLEKAAKWYLKSAAQGNTAAQHQLAVMYEKGEGVPQDLKKARYYYEEAAKSKYEEPKKALEEFNARYQSKN